MNYIYLKNTDMLSIIITHRGSNTRLNNLLRVVDNYNELEIDKEIIIIEQDEKPHINEFIPSYCKYLFAYNPGLFNKCWGFNIGYKHSESGTLLFADSDILYSNDKISKALKHIKSYGTVKPWSRCFSLSQGESEWNKESIFKTRKKFVFLSPYAGGSIMFHRESFELVGGWDERFRGWGVEDNEMNIRIDKILGRKYRVPGNGYHLWHERTKNDTNRQPNWKYNDRLMRRCKLLNKEQLIRLASIEKIGNIERYKK